MAPITYLNRYHVLVGDNGVPIELDGSAPGSTIYKAEEIHTGNTVALRVVDLTGLEAGAREHLLQAATAAKQLRRINIPTLYNFAVQGDQLICASQILEGTAADAWVTAHGPMPTGPALRIALQVASLLESATFHGLFHPALNPSNILLVPGQAPDGEWPLIKVLNFLDVAPLATDETARRFASPEQLLGARVDFQSEIYSLGCTLCYLVTGDVPGPGTAFSPEALPKPLAELIGHMVATDPAERSQDPVALQEEIRACLEQVERREAISRRFGPVAVAPVDPVVHTARRPGLVLKPLALAAGFLLLAGIAAFGLAQARRSSNSAGGKDGKPLGVAVGIPENAAVAAADANPEPPSTSSTIAAAPDTPAAEPPTLVSKTTESAPTVEPAQEPPAPVAKTEQALSAVASNPPPALPPPAEPPPPTIASPGSAAIDHPAPSMAEADQPAQPVVAANAVPPPTAEPQPPAEAPATASRTVTSDQLSTADDASQAATVRKPATSESQRVAKAAKKRPTRIANREVRRAEPVDDFGPGAPPLPRGSRRARFVGVAPDGSLMFELPSQERVYDAPVGGVRDHSRRRRSRQVIDDLPVLRAEPVSEEERD